MSLIACYRLCNPCDHVQQKKKTETSSFVSTGVFPVKISYNKMMRFKQ